MMTATFPDSTLEAPAAACLDTEQVAPAFRRQERAAGNAPLALLVYLLIGAYLGVIFVQSEVVSWYRIQEMFRFDSFHMYGVIGSAIFVAALSLALIKHLKLTTVHGAPIRIEPKVLAWPGTRYWAGGTLFGLGWGLVGACPGPIFALIGTGLTVMVAVLGAALVGTWTYGALRHRLPH